VSLDNRITLQKLEVFCLVVELGGVGRAAEHLFVAQPVVSAHLQTLQQRLGAQLLYRDGRRMVLTEAGEAAYAWAKEVLSRSHEVVREIEGLAEGSGGSAVVTASMSVGSYILPGVLSRFRREHPRAQLTLHVADPEGALHAVEVGDADFAVLMTDLAIEPRLFTVEPLASEEVVLVAAPDDPQVGDSVTVAELDGLRYVCSPGGLSRRRLVDVALQKIGVEERDIVLELGHPEAMKRAAADALGVCLLFRSSVQRELDDGSLREVTIEGAKLHVPIVLVQRAGKRVSPLQAELMAAVRADLDSEITIEK
jgi:DNA-binding transcriptional LysR family regulator